MKKSGFLKFISAVLVIALAASVFAGCSNSQKQETEDNGKLNVITSNFPPYDFLREIGGDKINLKMLISPGAESHSYEPTPQDIANVNNCDVFVYVGGNSDQWVGSLISSGDNQDMEVVKMMDCVELLDEPEEEGHDHEHDRVEDQKADRVLFPVLVGFGGAPDHFVEEALDFLMRGPHEAGSRAHHLEHPFPERQRNQDRQPENGNCKQKRVNHISP